MQDSSSVPLSSETEAYDIAVKRCVDSREGLIEFGMRVLKQLL